MSMKNPLHLRVIAVGGSAVLALGVSTGVAAAQAGSLGTGFGPDVESVLGPTGDLFPEPGSLDEVVSDAQAGSAADSSDARGEAQRALPPPSGSGSAAGGPVVDGSRAGAPAVGALTGIEGVGSLEPLQLGLGAGDAAAPDAPDPGLLGSGSGHAGGPVSGAGAATAHGAALTALLGLTGGYDEGGVGAAELPPLPPLR